MKNHRLDFWWVWTILKKWEQKSCSLLPSFWDVSTQEILHEVLFTLEILILTFFGIFRLSNTYWKMFFLRYEVYWENQNANFHMYHVLDKKTMKLLWCNFIELIRHALFRVFLKNEFHRKQLICITTQNFVPQGNWALQNIDFWSFLLHFWNPLSWAEKNLFIWYAFDNAFFNTLFFWVSSSVCCKVSQTDDELNAKTSPQASIETFERRLIF